MRILALLDGCQKELDVAMFAFTDNRLADAVIRCHQRGVQVRMVVDDVQAEGEGADAKRLALAGLAVRHDGRDGGHMHHKFAAIDRAMVLTGSFNWTVRASQKNREHIVVIHDKAVAFTFKQEFEKLWHEFESNKFANRV